MAGTVYQTEKDIVNKLSVLEYVVGFPDYKLYVPSADFRSSDVISIQREAARMKAAASTSNLFIKFGFILQR